MLSDTEKRRSYDEMRLRTEEASRLAESLKKRESEILYREQQLRERTWERQVYREPKTDTSDGIKRNSTPTFTMAHLKYSLYVVIAMLVFLIGSKQEPVSEPTKEPEYSEAKSSPSQKKKRKSKKNVEQVQSATTNIAESEESAIDSSVVVETVASTQGDTPNVSEVSRPIVDTLAQ